MRWRRGGVGEDSGWSWLRWGLGGRDGGMEGWRDGGTYGRGIGVGGYSSRPIEIWWKGGKGLRNLKISGEILFNSLAVVN
jgi:hypothetical protein